MWPKAAEGRVAHVSIVGWLLDITVLVCYFPLRDSMPAARQQQVCDPIIKYIDKLALETPQRSTLLAGRDFDDDFHSAASVQRVSV